ncbi:MAG TPA: TonB family protein [Myxococcales bacterium]|nr:TonB family protein [Myxococcales bacterium]
MIAALLLAAQLTKLPQLLDAPPAVYPPERLARGETADVACTVDIDENGAVTQVSVETPGAPDFDAAAVEAIRRFRFSPAEMDGKPAAVRIRYVYHFVIEQKRVEKPPATAGTVKGSVVEAGNRRPLPGAEVIDDTGAMAAADAQGRYALLTAAGARKLTVSAPGFESRAIDVTVPEEGTVEARKVTLHRTAVGDLQATVPGEKPHDAPTRRTLTHDELVNVPGSLNDPIRAVQNLPGLARAPFLGGALLVRGSPPQDTGTYLDGHRIPQLYHFLGGPSVINEQLLDRIDFYPGGYGAVYGRNLTGAIDVGTRKGDSTGLHGQASLDMIEAMAFLEGPLGERTQGAIAARRSHIDVFLPLFIPNDPNQGVTSIVPVYWDYQARLDHKMENGDDLGLLIFGSDDRLSLIQEGGRRTLPLSVDSHLGFNRIVGAWKRTVSDTLSLSVSPALGWTRQSAQTAGAGPGGFANPQSLDLTVLTAELRAEARWRARDFLELRAGADIELDRASYTADIQSSLQLVNLGFPITQQTLIDRVQPVQLWGEYVEAQITAGKLSLTPGLRFDQFHWRDHARWSIDPRLWARYAFGERTALKAYVGLYHQPPSGQQIDNDIGNPDLGLSWAAQFGAGVEQRFSDVWSASVELFYNRRGSLVVITDPVLNPDGTVYNPHFTNNGIGRAYGLELLIRREITAKLYGWLAYTLSRSQILNNPGDNWRAFQFDQPHILTLVAGYRPKPQWDLSTRFRLVSGNPYGPVDFATFNADSGNFTPTRGEVGEAREPLFLQLDVRAQYTWIWDSWQLSLYLDVQNVTNHANEEFHVYDYRFAQQGSITGLPILPTLGVKGKF